jgi:hypothetical protein|tara:strand:- start:197 stop:427 length:231 start_codon:yes stop_codon:yes gene_type:complete
MTDNEDKKLNDCYQELFRKVVELQAKYSNQMIAGNMMAQALRIYKSTLDDKGFEAMVDTISESKDRIEPFDKPTLN